MRRHLWSASILATLLLLYGAAGVQAQFDAGDYSDAGGVRLTGEALPIDPVPFDPDLAAEDPPPYAYDPNVFGPCGYPPAPTNSPIMAGEAPPGSQPWPTMSPFMEQQFRQRTFEKGLWFDEGNSRGMIYHAGASYLVSKFSKVNNTLVGDQRPGVTPFSPAQPGLFAPVRLANIWRSQPETEGFQVHWGYLNPDNSGLEMKWFLLGESNMYYQRGNGLGDINNINYLRPSNGISYFDGVGSGGTTVPYDKLFSLTKSTFVTGGTLDFLQSQWIKKDWFQLRPSWGGRYMYIQQKFTFVGADSGLIYVVSPNGTVVPGTVGTFPQNFGPWDSYFQARSDAHLAGPEIGLRYDIGGDSFKLWGATKFGLMGNFERLSLEGKNLGDGLQTFNFSANPQWFKSVIRNSHVSPLLETSINADIPIFRLIPYINKSQLFETAKFQLGYTYTLVGEVARPEDGIIYNGAPLQAEIKNNRSSFHMSTFNFGVDWTY